MKIAVTGASGFVGGHLVRSLAHDGHDVVAFSRRRVPKTKQVKHVAWDLVADSPAVGQAIDFFIHAAAITDLRADYSYATRINVEGTKKAYGLARKLGARGFIHISSASVYTSRENKFRVKEDFTKAGAQDNNYALTKLQAEAYLMSRHGLPTTILRPHIIYGPGDTRILYELLGKVRSQTLRLPMNGSFDLSVTHVGNIVDAVRFLLWQQPSGVRAYNIADAEYVSSELFIQKLLACADLNIRVRRVGAAPAWVVAVVAEVVSRFGGSTPLLTRNVLKQLNQDSSLSTARLAKLGFVPKYAMPDGMRDLAAWLHDYGGMAYYMTHASRDIWPGVTAAYVY